MAKGPAKDKAMRKAYRAYSKKIEKNKCNKAARCALTPYEPSRCCPPQTPHHLVPKSQFYKKSVDDGKKLPGCKKYNANKAPCICVEGTNHSMASHGLLHFDQKAAVEKRFFKNKKPEFTGKERWSCTEAEQQGADAVEKIFPQCSAACIKAQLRAAHREQGIKADTKIKPTNPGPKERPDFDPAPNGLSR